jgi:hypothetical protein
MLIVILLMFISLLPHLPVLKGAESSLLHNTGNSVANSPREMQKRNVKTDFVSIPSYIVPEHLPIDILQEIARHLYLLSLSITKKSHQPATDFDTSPESSDTNCTTTGLHSCTSN